MSWIFLKVRYKLLHIIGVSICLVGVGCLVWADIEEGRGAVGGETGPAGRVPPLLAPREGHGYMCQNLPWVVG